MEHDTNYVAWGVDVAAQLEEAMTGKGLAPLPEGVDAATLGDIGVIIEKTVALIAALRASEWKKALKLTRDLINLIIGENGGTIEFAQASALGDNFKRKLLEMLVDVVLKLVLKKIGA